MYRRTVFAGVAVTLTAPAAGCVDGIDDEPGATPPPTGEVPVLQSYTVSDHAVEPDVEPDSDMDAWGVYVASRDVAERYWPADGDDADRNAVGEFVAETDFDAGKRLLYVQAFAPQTCYELVPGEDPSISEEGLPEVPLVVDRTAPEDQACADAITPVDLLARLSFDPYSTLPDELSVTISGHRDRPEELRLEAER